MGCNAVIKLKPTTRVSYVADAMAIMLGGTPERTEFRSGGGWHTTVHGVKCTVVGSSTPGLAEIGWEDAKFERESSGSGGYCLYHFEGDGGLHRMMLPRSSPLWIAIGRRLIDIFGGSILCNDTADKPKTFRSKGRFAPGESDASFYKNQNLMLSIKKLTLKEIEACERYAAYPDKVKETE